MKQKYPIGKEELPAVGKNEDFGWSLLGIPDGHPYVEDKFQGA